MENTKAMSGMSGLTFDINRQKENKKNIANNVKSVKRSKFSIENFVKRPKVGMDLEITLVTEGTPPPVRPPEQQKVTIKPIKSTTNSTTITNFEKPNTLSQCGNSSKSDKLLTMNGSYPKINAESEIRGIQDTLIKKSLLNTTKKPDFVPINLKIDCVPNKTQALPPKVTNSIDQGMINNQNKLKHKHLNKLQYEPKNDKGKNFKIQPLSQSVIKKIVASKKESLQRPVKKDKLTAKNEKSKIIKKPKPKKQINTVNTNNKKQQNVTPNNNSIKPSSTRLSARNLSPMREPCSVLFKKFMIEALSSLVDDDDSDDNDNEENPSASNSKKYESTSESETEEARDPNGFYIRSRSEIQLENKIKTKTKK